MNTYHVIREDASSEDVPAKNDESSLKALQTLVGGYVECVQIVHATPARMGLDLWLNEEGKFREDFGRNEIATFLCHRLNLIAPGDWIAGPVVIAQSDHEGATHPFTPEALERFGFAMRDLILEFFVESFLKDTIHSDN